MREYRVAYDGTQRHWNISNISIEKVTHDIPGLRSHNWNRDGSVASGIDPLQIESNEMVALQPSTSQGRNPNMAVATPSTGRQQQEMEERKDERNREIDQANEVVTEADRETQHNNETTASTNKEDGARGASSPSHAEDKVGTEESTADQPEVKDEKVPMAKVESGDEKKTVSTKSKSNVQTVPSWCFGAIGWVKTKNGNELRQWLTWPNEQAHVTPQGRYWVHVDGDCERCFGNEAGKETASETSDDADTEE